MIQLAVLFLVALVFARDSNQDKQLDRIKRYTLIEVDTTRFESELIIELDAYEQHYEIQLIPNEHVHPGKLKHINGNHAEINGHPQFYTHLNDTCHYHGKVLNDKTSTTNWIALSLCDNRGIRGMIVAFDDTLYIKPAKTYLDLSHDKNGHGHNLNDEHLAYLSSDEDYEGLPFDEHVRISEDEKKFHDSIYPHKMGATSHPPNRRRMANSNRNLVEILAVSDPAFTQSAINQYTEATFYENLVSDLADMYNGISAEYTNQNWGSSTNGQIGTIAVAFAQLYVQFQFSGDDAELYPDFTYSNCKNMMNEDCSIDGSGYLGKLRTWVGNLINSGKLESTDFDDVQLWSSMNFKDAGGWGYIGTVCRGSLATANIAALYGVAWSIRSAAHELGHNFDMSHDQDVGGPCNSGQCDKDSGLMGYGNSNHGFSSCSLCSLQAYFAERDGLTCLGASNYGYSTNSMPGTGQLRSNYGGDNGGGTGNGQTDPPTTPAPTTKSPTRRPTPAPTTRAPTTKAPTAAGVTPTPTRRPTPQPTNKPTSTTVAPRPTKAPVTPNPTSGSGTSDDWECFISSFPVLTTSTFSSNTIGGDTLQGIWVTEDGGLLNGKRAYGLRGYYLYHKSGYWLIGKVKDSWSVVAYCQQSSSLLSACTGNWKFYQGGWYDDTDAYTEEADCGTSGGGGGDTVVVPPGQCQYFACLQMSALEVSGKSNYYYDGNWGYRGCFNGIGYYRNEATDNRAIGERFLCLNEQYNYWFIASEVCSASSVYAYCKYGDINKCAKGAWKLFDSGAFKDAAEAIAYDCDNSAFNAEETTVCRDTSLNDKICVYGESDLITDNDQTGENKLEFALFESKCANDKPIYSFEYSNTTGSIITINGVGEDETISKIYYLHYNLYKKYSDDEEFSGQWVISDGEVNSDYDAVCEQESILDCLAGQWQVLSQTDETGGGIIQFIDDIVMRIDNADCDGNTNFAVDDDESGGGSAVVIIIVCIVLLLVVAGCGYFFWRRSNKGDDDMIQRHVSNNATAKTTDAGGDQMPDQGSPVPETEVSMERKDGAQEITVTTTYE